MRILITSLILAFSIHAAAQNYIGMQKEDIIILMKKNRPNFKLDKDAINRTYNYIKFVDKISEQTLIFFLSESNHCTYVRWMSDYANLNEIIAGLDNKYKKKDEKTWIYTDKGHDYIVKLEEGEWFFTVSFRKK